MLSDCYYCTFSVVKFTVCVCVCVYMRLHENLCVEDSLVYQVSGTCSYPQPARLSLCKQHVNGIEFSFSPITLSLVKRP